MSRQVTCDAHGETEATIVCAHIIDTLNDEKPRGFLWSLDEDNEYQAVCTDCHNMPRDEWSERATELGRILCFGCYKKAAMLNGVDIETDGETMQ